MDGLFVARRGSRSDEGSLSSLDRDGARQIVEAMAQEIAVDEACEAMDWAEATPDQRRMEASLHKEAGIVDSLFARRRDTESLASEGSKTSAAGAAAAATVVPDLAEQDGLADTLFARPKSARSDPKPKASLELDSDPSEGSEPEAAPEAGEAFAALEADRTAADGKPKVDEEKPSYAESRRCSCSVRTCSRCLPFLVLAALLALVTAAIATGCEEMPPLGRFCIAEGPIQWVLAFAPALLTLLALGGWLRRRRSRQKHTVETQWQQDGDAHRSALELLDVLLDSPPAEAFKYSKQVLQMGSDFLQKAAIQHKVCLAVEAICREQKSHVARMKADGAVPILLKALEEHRRVRQVQQAALDALSCMTKEGRQEIFDLGGIPSVITAMAKFRRDADVQVAGALVLGGLCVSSTSCRFSVAKYGGINALIAALDRHNQRPDVVIAASECLALLASGRQAELLERAMPALPLVQEQMAEIDSEDASTQAVLRSLQKLEAQLLGTKQRSDEDEWSDVGTPRQKVQTAMVKSSQEEAKQVVELHERFHRWNERKSAEPKST
ncbi:unnamed protein product [Durusdinium trenchii]|uniref:Uncharacterized protein n=2 Tax=Durusdinium trenchii TaxID=1381693 RepID=A0ABP0P0G5_9DINO